MMELKYISGEEINKVTSANTRMLLLPCPCTHCAHPRTSATLQLKHKESKNKKINDSIFSHKPYKTEETFSPVCFETARRQAARVSASDGAASAAETAAGETGCCWAAGPAAGLGTAAAGDSA